MKFGVLFSACALLSFSALSEELKVNMVDLSTNKPLGDVVISSNSHGVVFSPEITGLTPGLHGFHVHVKGSCQSSTKDGKLVLGGAAGGHYDPEKTGKHGYPWTKGNHLGDLPALYVDAHGVANQPVLAPRLKLAELKGRALMIHEGGDNHSDNPSLLGGGGSRVACGIIK